MMLDNDAEETFEGPQPPEQPSPAQCRMRTQAQGESPSEEARYQDMPPTLSNAQEEKMSGI